MAVLDEVTVGAAVPVELEESEPVADDVREAVREPVALALTLPVPVADCVLVLLPVPLVVLLRVPVPLAVLLCVPVPLPVPL